MNLSRAYAMNILGYFFIALFSILRKSLPNELSPFFIMFGIMLVCLLIVLCSKNWSRLYKTEHIFKHFCRASLGLVSFTGLMYAIKYLTVSESLLLQYTSPLYIPLLVFVWYGSWCTRKQSVLILTGFVGLMFILKPTQNVIHFAAIIGLISGVTHAISYFVIKDLSKTDKNITILFYYFLISVILTLPSVYTNSVSLASTDFLIITVMGILMFIAQLLITKSFFYAPVSLLAPNCYFSVLFAGIIEWYISNAVPDIQSFTGMVIIIVSGVALLKATSEPPAVTLVEPNSIANHKT